MSELCLSRACPVKVIDFTSTRKRMSVIVEDSNGKITIYMKGADNFIRDRLKKSEYEDPRRKALMDATQKQTDLFSEDGLRTLFVSSHEVDRAYYEDWQKKYNEAIELKDRKKQASLYICERMV